MNTRYKRILATLVIIAGFLVALYAAAPAILSKVALRIASGTVDIEELDIESVGLERVSVAVIRANLNQARFHAQDAVIAYDLWPFRIRRIDVGRAHVTTSSSSSSAGQGEAAVGPPVGLPFDVSIKELEIDTETPWGPVSITASVRTGPGKEGGYEADILNRDFAAHLRNMAPNRHSLEVLDENKTELLALNAVTGDGFPVAFDGRLHPESIARWINTSSSVPAGLKNLLAPYRVERDEVQVDGSLQQNLDFTARLLGSVVVRDSRGETERLFESLEIRCEKGYAIGYAGTSWTGSGNAMVTFIPIPGTTVTALQPTWAWDNGILSFNTTGTKLEELAVSANAVDIKASGLETDKPTGEITIDGVKTEWWPEALEQYNVTGNWMWQDPAFQAQGTGTGWALPELKWNVKTEGAEGRVEVTSSQAVAPLKSSLQHYTSALARELYIKSGDLDGHYHFEWDADHSRSTVNVTVGPADLDLDEMEVRGLKIALNDQGNDIDRFDMSVSAPRFKLAAGTEAEDFDIKMRVAYPEIRVDAASTRMFGGDISVRPTSFNLEKDSEFVLNADIDGLSLEKIMALFELESTQLTGDVAGPVRVVFSRERGIEINEGDLHSIHPGVLRFSLSQGSETTAQLGNIAIKALEDFQYRELNASVIYRPNGDYRIAARIVGSNPAVLDGHAIALNPTIEGNLPALFRAFFITGDFDRAIVEQLQNEGALSTPGETSTFKGD